jgi:hypothetical protein
VGDEEGVDARGTEVSHHRLHMGLVPHQPVGEGGVNIHVVHAPRCEFGLQGLLLNDGVLVTEDKLADGAEAELGLACAGGNGH